jgi:hypothetical protein
MLTTNQFQHQPRICVSIARVKEENIDQIRSAVLDSGLIKPGASYWMDTQKLLIDGTEAVIVRIVAGLKPAERLETQNITESLARVKQAYSSSEIENVHLIAVGPVNNWLDFIIIYAKDRGG